MTTRFIPYRKFKDETTEIDTFFVLSMFVNDARKGGVTYAEMGRRIKFMDRIDEMRRDSEIEGFTVNDAEYSMLRGIDRYEFPWGANRYVHQIIGDVLEAKEEQPSKKD